MPKVNTGVCGPMRVWSHAIHWQVCIGFSEFCTLRLKWCVLVGSKMNHSVFVALIRRLCCQSMQWNETWHTKTWLRRSLVTLKATNAWCIGVNPVLTLQLWRNLLIMNSTNIKMMRNLITVSGTLQIEQHWQPLQPLRKNTKRLWLIRHSYIAKLTMTSCWYRTKYKATAGVKNGASYIPWLYYLGPEGSPQHDSLIFILNDSNHYTSFLSQVQIMLVDYLKANHPHIKKLLLWRFWRTVQKLQELYGFMFP